MKTPYLTHPSFITVPTAKYGYFTREGGVSHGYFEGLNCGVGTGDLLDNVYENHRRIAAEFSADAEQLLFCKQIHSTKVITVTEAWQRHARPEADAMVTTQKGLVLAVMSADCAPILFVDPHKHIIGAAHSGWKGSLDGIGEATVDAMEQLGAHAGDIHACIGPCILQDSYEVGPEFPEPFMAQDKANVEFFKPAMRAEHFMFNMPRYIEKRLKQRGIKHISGIELDTVSNEKQLFSYRRRVIADDLQNGVQMSAICLS